MSELEIPKHQPWFETELTREAAHAAQEAYLRNILSILEQSRLSKTERKILPRMKPKHLLTNLRERVRNDEPDGTIELQCALQKVLRYVNDNRRQVFCVYVAESVGCVSLNDLAKPHRVIQAKMLASEYADSLVEALNNTREGEEIEAGDGNTVVTTSEHVAQIREYLLSYYPVLTEWYERCIGGTLPLYSTTTEH